MFMLSIEKKMSANYVFVKFGFVKFNKMLVRENEWLYNKNDSLFLVRCRQEF